MTDMDRAFVYIKCQCAFSKNVTISSASSFTELSLAAIKSGVYPKFSEAPILLPAIEYILKSADLHFMK